MYIIYPNHRRVTSKTRSNYINVHNLFYYSERLIKGSLTTSLLSVYSPKGFTARKTGCYKALAVAKATLPFGGGEFTARSIPRITPRKTGSYSGERSYILKQRVIIIPARFTGFYCAFYRAQLHKGGCKMSAVDRKQLIQPQATLAENSSLSHSFLGTFMPSISKSDSIRPTLKAINLRPGVKQTKNDSYWFDFLKQSDEKMTKRTITAVYSPSGSKTTGFLKKQSPTFDKNLDSLAKTSYHLITTRLTSYTKLEPSLDSRSLKKVVSTNFARKRFASGNGGFVNRKATNILNVIGGNLTLSHEMFSTTPALNVQKKAFTYPLHSFHRSNQDTCLIDKVAVKEGDWVESGDLLADSAASVAGELAIGHNIIVAYMPWEGYNYEDAILINERLVYEDIYTSIHIERYDIETKDTKDGPETITREIPEVTEKELSHLDKNGIAKLGSWIEEGDILVGKVTPFNPKLYSATEKFMYELFGKKLNDKKDSSLRAPKGIKAHVINVNILARVALANLKRPKEKRAQILDNKKKDTHLLRVYSPSNGELLKRAVTSKTISQITAPQKGEGGNKEKLNPLVKRPTNVHIYLAEKRKIQVGDKMAGRHGNKGIVSRILPRQDMPFLPDGTPLDIVLNPLGVPSRMNVGQIYECLLGLAGRYLGEHYKIAPFDEIYGAEASRSFVFSKLFEARKKTGITWLFDPNSPGKMRLFDGRTSECFDQTVTVGIAYVLKLVHMVDDKMHARSTGPYSLVTQQPLRGRSKQGGQRLGEMEVWAIEGYGAAFVLSEMLTIKSDNMAGRQTLWVNLINNNDISLGTPESFKVLVCELQALCLDIGLFRQNVDYSPLYGELLASSSNQAATFSSKKKSSTVTSVLTGKYDITDVQTSRVSSPGGPKATHASKQLIEIDSLLHLA